MDKATIKAINTLSKNIGATANLLTTLKDEYAELRLKALRTVETTKVGETITLESGNSYGRFKVTEGKKTLVNEYMGGGIHDLRFDIAMGNI